MIYSGRNEPGELRQSIYAGLLVEVYYYLRKDPLLKIVIRV